MAGPAETSTDLFLGGRVTLVQPRRGHRAGLDAALLQASVPGDARGRAVDLGSGAGSVAFAVAARAPAMEATGIERDAVLVSLAEAALRLPQNASFAGRVRMVQAEIGAEPVADLGREGISWVLMNPPFDEPGSVSASPHPGKRSAYLAEAGLLDAWVGFAARLLPRGGHVAMIHRAAALPAIFAALGNGFGDLQVLAVHPRADEPASRVVVRATKGRRTPARILPPLVLHPRPDGAPGGGGAAVWTAEAAALLAGAACLKWL